MLKKVCSMMVAALVAVSSPVAVFADVKEMHVNQMDAYEGTLSSGASYSIWIEEDTMKMEIEADPDYLFKLNVDGVESQSWQGVGRMASMKLPNKDEMNVFLLSSDKNEDRFERVAYFKLRNAENGWVIRTEDTILERNKEQLGIDQYASMSAVPDSIQKLSDQICEGVTDDYAKALKIHDWMTTELVYDFDREKGDRAATINAEKVIAEGKGKCGGFSDVFAKLCRAQGIPCINVYGATSDDVMKLKKIITDSPEGIRGDAITHAWNECFVDGRWIIVDTTWDNNSKLQNGEEKKGANHYAYFDPTLEFFSTTHLAIAREGYKSADVLKLPIGVKIIFIESE